MREVVVDACVSAKWFVREEHSANALRLLACEALHAPDHWQAEAATVLWSKVRKAELSVTQATDRVRGLLRAPVIGTPIARLIPRAFAISLAHIMTLYDSLYVALAVDRSIPLVTADVRMIRKLSSDVSLAKLMVWVGDVTEDRIPRKAGQPPP